MMTNTAQSYIDSLPSVNGKFTYAYFNDSKKNYITATWLNTDEQTYTDIIIPTNLEDADYKNLLETFTVDEISTMTDQKSKDEAQSFELIVKDVAEKYGLVYDPNAADNKDRLSVDHIFNPPEGDVGTDLLFEIKLKIFDIEEVVNSTNDDLKKQLREANTPLKALYIAGKFLFE